MHLVFAEAQRELIVKESKKTERRLWWSATTGHSRAATRSAEYRLYIHIDIYVCTTLQSKRNTQSKKEIRLAHSIRFREFRAITAAMHLTLTKCSIQPRLFGVKRFSRAVDNDFWLSRSSSRKMDRWNSHSEEKLLVLVNLKLSSNLQFSHYCSSKYIIMSWFYL